MNRKMSKLIRAFSKLTNKSYRAMKKEFHRLSDKERFKSKKDLQKIYNEGLEQGYITKNYRDLKIPLKANKELEK